MERGLSRWHCVFPAGECEVKIKIGFDEITPVTCLTQGQTCCPGSPFLQDRHRVTASAPPINCTVHGVPLGLEQVAHSLLSGLPGSK